MSLTRVQYLLLKRFFPRSAQPESPAGVSSEGPEGFYGRTKLEKLLGAEVLAAMRGKHLIDFGCGEGHEAIALARLGASHVTGIDIREEVLQLARQNAAGSGVGHRCDFATTPKSKADIVISIDAFEHFADPAAILDLFDRLLVPGGKAVVSFGPTWYHPLGGHLFSVFPWAHLLFSEQALLRWRADFKSDGAAHFGEVAGGLNQMTVARFEETVAQSPFAFQHFEAVPINRLRPVHNRFTREFTTAIVRCILVRQNENSVMNETASAGVAIAPDARRL